MSTADTRQAAKTGAFVLQPNLTASDRSDGQLEVVEVWWRGVAHLSVSVLRLHRARETSLTLKCFLTDPSRPHKQSAEQQRAAALPEYICVVETHERC